MSIDKQTILNDLNLKNSLYSSVYSTPIMFSRDSSMDTLSSFNVNFHSHNSTYASEHSTNPSGILSPSEIPDSPPRGCDDEIDIIEQQQALNQPLNNTNSTGRTIVPRNDSFVYDDIDVDSIKDYTASPPRIYYDDDDDNDSINSSLSSLTLPPPPSSSSTSSTSVTGTKGLLTNINDLRNLKHNLSVINEESLHEHNENRKSSINMSNTTITTTTDDDDDDEDDQKGKRLLFELIRQRLPNHPISLKSTSDSSSKATNDDDDDDEEIETNNSRNKSNLSSLINDQTMRDDTSNHGLSSNDITIPSSTMQESGYDSLLPMGSAPKRSLSNASISTTHSIITKKRHRCNEENDDPMGGCTNNPDDVDNDDDEDYDKKAGEALLRNLIAQVLPSFNPRYLNADDDNNDDNDDEGMSIPCRPSPSSQVYSSSNASSVRSIDIEINKKSEKNLYIRSNKNNMPDIIQKEKIQSKRLYTHKPVHQTKASELRRLQSHARR